MAGGGGVDDETYDHLYKLIMVGDKGVGKTSLLERFAKDEDFVFSEEVPTTVGVDFRSKIIELDGETTKLQIWDTAGDERFRSITNAYFRGARGVLIVYDVTNRDSFNNVQPGHYKMAKDRAGDEIRIGMVGNKSDLSDKRAVTFGQGKELATDLGVLFMETSVKEGQNVADPFIQLVIDIRRGDLEVAKNRKNGSRRPESLRSASRLSSSSSETSSTKSKKITVLEDSENAKSKKMCCC